MLTHFLTSQPALIKLDNENIGGHLTPLHIDIILDPLSQVKRYRYDTMLTI